MNIGLKQSVSLLMVLAAFWVFPGGRAWAQQQPDPPDHPDKSGWELMGGWVWHDGVFKQPNVVKDQEYKSQGTTLVIGYQEEITRFFSTGVYFGTTKEDSPQFEGNVIHGFLVAEQRFWIAEDWDNLDIFFAFDVGLYQLSLLFQPNSNTEGKKISGRGAGAGALIGVDFVNYPFFIAGGASLFSIYGFEELGVRAKATVSGFKFVVGHRFE